MRTWNDYKEHVKSVDPEIGKDMDEATLAEWRQKIQDEPRRFILQEVMPKSAQ